MKKLIPVVTAIVFASCGGGGEKPVASPVPAEKVSETPGTAAAPAGLAASGEDVYKKTCLACHQANGEGIANTFPPLAKSDFLLHRDQVIEQVIKGKSGEMVVNGVTYNGTMPPQALSDAEIASVLTYVYSSWGNTGNSFTAEEVKAIREKSN